MHEIIDILMITFNRAAYTRLSLARLLETCDESCRVWLWHNGEDEDTLEVVKSFLDHPCVHQFHHSRENKKLREPTNWLWANSDGDFLCKIDDDCLMEDGWVAKLIKAHLDNPCFGIIGCWRFQEEDFIPDMANKKIMSYSCGHRVMRNCWVEGSGYLMKRACVQEHGLIKAAESFTAYCIRTAASGWINGWYFPFIPQEHMDDPRSELTLLRCDADIEEWLPLSAKNSGVRTLSQWEAQLKRSARIVQEAPLDPRLFSPWRQRLRRKLNPIRQCFGLSEYLW